MESNPQKLAEQIANLFLQNESEREASDLKSLRRSVERIDERLSKIESALFEINPQSAIRTSHFAHPSQEKFEIADGFAPEKGEQFETEKPCPFEPTGKPCDHCSMCSSRGF